MYERAIAHTLLTHRGIDLGLPERSIISFLLFSSLERVCPCVKKRLLCGTFFTLSAPFKSLSIAKKFFSFLMRYCTSFNSCHVLYFNTQVPYTSLYIKARSVLLWQRYRKPQPCFSCSEARYALFLRENGFALICGG